MIEKVIHYCWFGDGNLSELENRCINSWEKVLHEYTIMRWDESNFPIDSHPYVKAAYEAGKFAFVSDYVRIWVLYNYGGIYLDTDYEILKPLDKFLNHRLFMGNENEEFIGTAIIGAEKGHWLLKQWMDYYDDHSFEIAPNTYNMIPNTMIITDIMLHYGYNRDKKFVSNDISIYEKEVFFSTISEDSAYGIHYFRGSWWSEKEKKRANNKIYRFCVRPILLFIKKYLKLIVGTEKIYKIEIFIKGLLK